MDEPDVEAIACENCQTIGRSVAQRRTTSGRQVLCASCYANALSPTRLSSREAQVYAYADAGYSNEEIAEELGVDSSTVGSHLATVRRKYQQAVDLMDVVDPASTTSPQRAREFDGDPPRGLEPGVVVAFDEPNIDPSHSDDEFTHGIVRRVLTRSNTGVPTRIAVYPIAPEDGSIRMHRSAGMPTVVDQHSDFVEVVFPKNVLLRDLGSSSGGR